MRKIIIAIALILVPCVASGIIIRHDREDAKYLELGKKFPAVVFMVPDGEGTLIAPQWVLTAAHVARDRRNNSVRFDDGREIAVAQKILHPDWRDGGPHDVALVRLSAPVSGVEPVALYEASDEAGKTVTFVGRGDTGTGMTGPKLADKKKRAATNVVDSADADWLRFTFDEASAATDLEGVSGPGDSGGPALIERAGKLYIAGVSVFGSRGKYGPQTYGTREGYTRVSTHAKWIRATMQSPPPPAPAAAAAPQAAAPAASVEIPDTPAGRRMKAWLPVINRGDSAEIAKFVRENFAKRALEQMPADERIRVHTDFFAESGGIRVHSIRKSEQLEIEILAQTVTARDWMRIAIRTEPQEPFGIMGFMFDDGEPPAVGGPAPVREIVTSGGPSSAANAAAKLNATPAGRQLEAWLAALNSEQRDALREYLRANISPAWLKRIPMESHIQVHEGLKEETAGLQLESVAKNLPYEVSATAKASGGAQYRIDMSVEAEAPHRVLVMGFQPTTAVRGRSRGPAAPAAAPKAPAEIASAVENYASELAARDQFSGAVLLAKDGKTLLEKAWGKASFRYDAPNRVDTKFNLGSMNKMFTAVAIGQLVEQGKLSFQDKVGKILPDYPNAAVREKVTVHHLLTHTSGLGSYFSSQKYRDGWMNIRSVDGFVDTFAEEPPQFEPGARFSYSNNGFTLLGKIIEKVSGMNYYDYVREKIFKPAGMTDTDSFETDRDVPNLATGYPGGAGGGSNSEARLNNHFRHSMKGGPAGGGFSTVRDMLRFGEALRSNKLLGAQMTQTLLTGKVQMDRAPAQVKYAYGFGERMLNSKRVVGHNGGAPGISAEFNIVWEDGWTIVVLSNYDRAATAVSSRAEELILGLPQRVIVTN